MGVARYEIHRGRTNELERTGTGTATITMVDLNGSLDPSSGSSFYSPSAPVAIALHNPVTSTDHQIYGGKINRWGYELYPTERYGIATLECVDGMSILANAMLKTQTHGDPSAVAYYDGNVVYDLDTQADHRIIHALNDAQWPLGMREIFTGNVRVKRKFYSGQGTPILNVITDAADSEWPGVANFFFDKRNWATFHGRLARFNPTEPSYRINTWRVGDVAAVTADATRAPYFAIDYDEDDARVINDAVAYPDGIKAKHMPAQHVRDAGSIATFGTRSWSAENLLTQHGNLTGNNARDETRLFAEYYVNNFSDTSVRVNRIQFKTVHPSHPWAARVWALMCGIDISDRIQITATHHDGASGFNEYTGFVEGLHYTVLPLNETFMDVTLDVDLSPAANWTSLP